MAGTPAIALGRAAPEGAAEAALEAAPPELTGVLEVTDRLAADEEAAEAEEADDAADEAADEAAEAEETVVAAAEEVPLRVADPEPVVVMAPVVAMPEVEALALRQALEDPGWMVSAEFPTETPVESVIKRVTEVPAAMFTTQV